MPENKERHQAGNRNLPLETMLCGPNIILYASGNEETTFNLLKIFPEFQVCNNPQEKLVIKIIERTCQHSKIPLMDVKT